MGSIVMLSQAEPPYARIKTIMLICEDATSDRDYVRKEPGRKNAQVLSVVA